MDFMNAKTFNELKQYLAEGHPEKFYSLYIWRHKAKPYVLARDHYECQRCARQGKHSKAEAVHHIVEIEERPELALRTDNLTSLCKACHNELHNRSFQAQPKFVNTERW